MNEWEKERDKVRALLRQIIKPGTEVVGKFLASTTRSVLYAFFIVGPEGGVIDITSEICDAIQQRFVQSQVRGNGCECIGDDGTRVIQHLARDLFGDDRVLRYRKFL